MFSDTCVLGHLMPLDCSRASFLSCGIVVVGLYEAFCVRMSLRVLYAVSFLHRASSSSNYYLRVSMGLSVRACESEEYTKT